MLCNQDSLPAKLFWAPNLIYRQNSIKGEHNFLIAWSINQGQHREPAQVLKGTSHAIKHLESLFRKLNPLQYRPRNFRSLIFFQTSYIGFVSMFRQILKFRYGMFQFDKNSCVLFIIQENIFRCFYQYIVTA